MGKNKIDDCCFFVCSYSTPKRSLSSSCQQVKDFRDRAKNSDPACPSYKPDIDFPIPMSIHSYRDHVIQMAEGHGFGDIDSIYKTTDPALVGHGLVYKGQQTKKKNPPTSSHRFSIQDAFKMSATYNSIVDVDPEATNAHGGKLLSFDHHHLTFLQFVWVQLFVSIPMRIGALKGLVNLAVRKRLYDRGWLRDRNIDHATLVAKIVLETSISQYYLGKREDDNGNVIGGFFCADFPYFEQHPSTKELSFKVADLLSIDIDLTNKCMVKAKLDDEDLNASEAVILIFAYMASSRHAQHHAFANWGISVDDKQVENNPFIARNGIVSIIYNYQGYHFGQMIPTFRSAPMSLLSKEWTPELFGKIRDHGILHQSWFTNIYMEDLYPYSEFVSFTEKLKPIFLDAFNDKKKLYFPGCNGEALFTGTVIHSLEHYGSHAVFDNKNLFCLDTHHPRFGAGAQLGLLADELFNDDLPFLLFHKRFRGSKHPFYEGVYEEAAKLNLKLANEIDTCIVK